MRSEEKRSILKCSALHSDNVKELRKSYVLSMQNKDSASEPRVLRCASSMERATRRR